MQLEIIYNDCFALKKITILCSSKEFGIALNIETSIMNEWILNMDELKEKVYRFYLHTWSCPDTRAMIAVVP